MLFLKNNIKKIYINGLIYAFILLLAGGVINYFTWTEGSVTQITSLYFIGWLALYAPFFIYWFYDSWEIKEFGFILNFYIILILLLLTLIMITRLHLLTFDNWHSSLIEAFARTGEELFFRGFLYSLLIRIFINQNKPWVWATIISSMSFALIHTQTFLPEYNANMLDIFVAGIILALLRKLTGSILPAIIIHIFLKSDILGVIFGLILYFVFVLASKLKGENIFQH